MDIDFSEQHYKELIFFEKCIYLYLIAKSPTFGACQVGGHLTLLRFQLKYVRSRSRMF